MAYHSNVHWAICLCVSVVHKLPLALGCIVMCDHPRAAIDSTREWQQAAVLLTSNDKLFVCVFMWSVRPERPSVAGCPPRPQQTRQDRASHFLQAPLVKFLIFTPVALELLCLSLWATSWWHSGQQTQQANSRKPGGWGSVGEAWEYKSNPRPRKSSWKRKSQTPCLGLFSRVLVDLWTYLSRAKRDHVDIPSCLCSSAVVYSSQTWTGPGRTLLSCRLSTVYVTFPRPSSEPLWPQAAI